MLDCNSQTVIQRTQGALRHADTVCEAGLAPSGSYAAPQYVHSRPDPRLKACSARKSADSRSGVIDVGRSESQCSTDNAIPPEDLEAYRVAVEQHAIVAVTNRLGKIVYANELFSRISGYPREQILGKTHRLVSSGHHPPEFWQQMWTTIAHGHVWHGEICNRARDGSLYWVDTTISPLRKPNGAIRGYMAVRHPITALKQARALQKSLEQSDAFKEWVLNSVSYAFVGTGPDLIISVFNHGAERLLGFRAEEVIGKRRIEDLCDARELQLRVQQLESLRDNAKSSAFESEWTYIRKDGTRVPVFVSLTALRNADGHFVGYLGVSHDVSAQRRAEDALHSSEEKFRSLYQAAPLAIVRSSLVDGRFLEANPAFHAMTGYAPEDLASLSISDLSPPCAAQQEASLVADLRRYGRYGPLERECVRKDGSRFQVLVNGMRDSGPDGRRFIWSIAQDITERKQMETELRHAAHFDKLTGLANRLLLREQLDQCIHRAALLPQHRFAVLYLDLDHFKSINDGLGHGAGDRVLQELAGRLRSTLRGHDLLARSRKQAAARLGGDEFVILLEDIAKADDATAVATRLLHALCEPFRLRGREFHLSASIGIVTSGPEHRTAEEYLRDADTAMYEAKRAGRNRYAIFDTRMRERVQRGLMLQNELRSAMQNCAFHLVFQPIVCLETGRVRACEALLRWRHPQLGLIPPSEFIPIAEDTGLILELGEWVLRTACAQFAQWRVRFGTQAPDAINVNLSRVQLTLDDLEQRVARTLTYFDVEPCRLHLEITETAVMQDPTAAMRTMHALRALGVKLDLDDFGTGYSSLGSIHEFPLDAIKIDRTFVHALDTGGDVSGVIEAVARLARHLNVEVIAEGIETVGQLEQAKKLGCHLGQGYLFTRPGDAQCTAAAFLPFGDDTEAPVRRRA